MLERETEGDGWSCDGSGDRRSRSGQERLNGAVASDLVEAWTAQEYEREWRCEGDERGEESAADASRGVTDDGHGLDHRTGSDLAEGDRVEELRAVIQW